MQLVEIGIHVHDGKNNGRKLGVRANQEILGCLLKPNVKHRNVNVRKESWLQKISSPPPRPNPPQAHEGSVYDNYHECKRNHDAKHVVSVSGEIIGGHSYIHGEQACQGEKSGNE